MTNRLLDFADCPASLSVENGLLVIVQPEKPRQTVPIDDIAAIVASHRQVVFTQSLVAALGAAGAILVCCDERHHPVSMLLPVEGHSTQTARFQAQASAAAPVRKRVWQELVREKLRMQGEVLKRLHGEDGGISALPAKVRSGDPDNLEATAAQRYWLRLFGDTNFRRGNEEEPRNAMLNYGYAILRAITARAVCAAGLHPSFGVNHSNRYNAFCLADDLMEPLRPLIDMRVAELCQGWAPEQWQVNKTSKLALLSAAAARYSVDGDRRTLFDVQARRASRLAAVLLGEVGAFHCERIELE